MSCHGNPNGTKTVPKEKVLAAWWYHNEEMVRRYAKENRCTYEVALHLFEQTKMFLGVAATAERPCAPSKKIDSMWHHFVLHTLFYEEYCKQLGIFVHHVPTEPSKRAGATITPEQLLAEAKELFGYKVDETLWPKTKGEVEKHARTPTLTS